MHQNCLVELNGVKALGPGNLGSWLACSLQVAQVRGRLHPGEQMLSLPFPLYTRSPCSEPPLSLFGFAFIQMKIESGVSLHGLITVGKFFEKLKNFHLLSLVWYKRKAMIEEAYTLFLPPLFYLFINQEYETFQKHIMNKNFNIYVALICKCKHYFNT